TPVREIDAEVQLTEIDFKAVEELQRLAPFGVGNPSPLLLVKAVTIESIIPLGQSHVRSRVQKNGYYVTAVGWGLIAHEALRKGAIVDLLFHAEINTYKGVSSAQLNVKDIFSLQPSS